MRHYRLNRNRSSVPRYSKKYKKVLDYATTSIAAGTKTDYTLVFGTDSIAVGQTGPTDVAVPTGAHITGFLVMFTSTNLVSITANTHIAFQLTRSGQSTVDPRLVGGNPQRNQVFKQALFTVGQNQNSNHQWYFKIPKMFGRVREGDGWHFTVFNDVIATQTVKIIYIVKQ